MHNICYLVEDENVKRSLIMDEICERASEDGHGYYSRFTWHDEISPVKNREEAEAIIKKLDNGCYDDHAVRFFDYSNTKKTAKIAEYEAKIAEYRKGKADYTKRHSIKVLSAEYIGCAKCGSRLNKKLLVGEFCPVCRNDLRSKTTLDKLEWYDDKIADYTCRIKIEQAKQTKVAKIKWLIKYEYHS